MKDRNYGLIKQCIVKHLHNNIERHTQTYVTLALKDIAESLKLPSAVGVPEKEAEIIILRMVSLPPLLFVYVRFRLKKGKLLPQLIKKRA